VYQGTDVGSIIRANIEDVRTAKQWSQAQLADRITTMGNPVHLSWVSKIENGQRRVTAAELVQIAAALDVSPARLVLRIDGGPLEITPSMALQQPEADTWLSGLWLLPAATRDGGKSLETLDGLPLTPEEMDHRREWFDRMATARLRRVQRVPNLWVVAMYVFRLADAVTYGDIESPNKDEWRSEALKIAADLERAATRIREDLEHAEMRGRPFVEEN
jgi:transcriptional regulator with XRE-family HTH domain